MVYFFNSIKITQKNVIFLISSDYWNTWVNFNLLMRHKYMKNIMRLILEEVIMLNRHMLDGQLYLFFNTEKISLN